MRLRSQSGDSEASQAKKGGGKGEVLILQSAQGCLRMTPKMDLLVSVVVLGLGLGLC